MRLPRFPTLSGFVHRLSKVEFKTDLTGAAREHYQNLLTARRSMKHVVLFPNGKGLAVRIFLAGKQLTLALLSVEEVEKASRLADMAQLFFEPYHVRARSSDFNTIRAQAQEDLDHHKEIHEVFKQFADELRRLKILPTDEELAKQKQLAHQPRVSGSIRDAQKDIAKQLSALTERLGKVETVLNEIWKRLYEHPQK